METNKMDKEISDGYISITQQHNKFGNFELQMTTKKVFL